MLFCENISDWEDWGRVFQSISAFTPLIQEIFRREGLECTEITAVTPGTNAVFRVGKLIVKIYAPAESSMDMSKDLLTELAAVKHCLRCKVPSARMSSYGVIADKYSFTYAIMPYIDGISLTELLPMLSSEEKREIGSQLRKLTDRINKPCRRFNNIDIMSSEHWLHWKHCQDSFLKERREYILSHDWGQFVFVHGDLCGDNVIQTIDGKLWFIDCADAVRAPICYEQALVAVELFHFNTDLIAGYFGNIDADSLADICFHGLLLHPYGTNIIDQHICPTKNFASLADFKDALYKRIQSLKF